MASPHGDSFYCLTPDELGDNGLLAYHVVTMLSAIAGLAGAIHQVRIWKQQLQRQRYSTATSSEFLTHSMARRTWEQRSVRGESSGGASRPVEGFVDPEVVVGLAYADALACITLIVRSIMAFSFKGPIPYPSNSGSNDTTLPDVMTSSSAGLLHGGRLADTVAPGTETPAIEFQPNKWWYELLGGPVEFFLVYFYVATYLWTLTYAVNVYHNLANKPMRPLLFKVLCWCGALLPASVSIFARFYPSGVRCATHDVNLYTTYSSLYIPILIVMIVNPIIYIKAFSRVTQVLKRTGQVTNQGRQMTLAVKYKFLLILFFFYICWTANIVDGILQFSKAYTAPPLGLWMAEAVLNPLQGLFNALIYGRHGLFKKCLLSLTRRRMTVVDIPTSVDREFTESDRLVRQNSRASDAAAAASLVVGTDFHSQNSSITASMGSALGEAG
ncbi:uncharacterized protein LOC135816048 [Sycon ciliatum]|uniref:uncharacterized protein LOC135816048 n=1 Tax=Sycon ciliatum TaxID=27933 RepID=UPI0031F6B01F